jgi:hypothetical protein
MSHCSSDIRKNSTIVLWQVENVGRLMFLLIFLTLILSNYSCYNYRPEPGLKAYSLKILARIPPKDFGYPASVKGGDFIITKC